ncbi:MAG TPA: hypothetical protein VIZ00_13455 [Streptosporangiaceae bacterium]
MRNARFWRLAVIITTAGGLSLAGAGTALAGGAARADLSVTIGTTSDFVPVNGNTLVRYGAPFPQQTAHVSGTVTGVPAGLATLTITLLEKPFGATAFTSAAGPATLRPAGGSVPYTFAVRPSLATAYEVAITATAATDALTSAASTVYVIPDITVTGLKCTRPACSGQLVITSRIPPNAFSAESGKKLDVYRGLRVLAGRTPAEPATLKLSGTATPLVQDTTKSTVQYTVPYGFRIGATDGYQWKINYCTPDTEGTDGVGLPGTHSCGDKAIRTDDPYLG